MDTTLFGSAKEGIVFLGDRMFIRNTFEKPSIFNFKDISEAEYICEKITKDSGKVLKREAVLLKLNDGTKQKLLVPSIGVHFEKLANFINGIINEGGKEKKFKTTTQTLPLSDMNNEIKSAYIKVVCNYAYSNDDIIDAKEYAEIISLIVRIEYNLKENGELAAELVERAILSEKVKGKPLVLHSDNGAPMKSNSLKSKLEVLGVLSSYSRPRVSNDNPFSEAQFKTLKYRPGYPQDGFKTIDEAREWVLEFVKWYNNKHYHSGLKFLTPNSRHNGQTDEIMNNRKKIYETARKLSPQRFNRGIRNWDLNDKVALNPTDEVKEKIIKGII